MTTPSKKELILQSALRNFVSKGYDRATMQNIAEEAGVGKGTIYEYFSSKEALFVEVIVSGIDTIIDTLIETVSAPGSFFEKIRRLYVVHIELFRTESDIRELMLRDVGKIPSEIRELLLGSQNKLLVCMEKAFKQAIENKEIRPVHPRVAASMTLNGLQVIYYYPLDENETYEQVIEEQLVILFEGLL